MGRTFDSRVCQPRATCRQQKFIIHTIQITLRALAAMMFSSRQNIGNAGFWVANAERLDEFDRRTATVKLHVPLQGASSGSSFYADRFGTFWIYHLSSEPPAVF